MASENLSIISAKLYHVLLATRQVVDAKRIVVKTVLPKNSSAENRAKTFTLKVMEVPSHITIEEAEAFVQNTLEMFCEQFKMKAQTFAVVGTRVTVSEKANEPVEQPKPVAEVPNKKKK